MTVLQTIEVILAVAVVLVLAAVRRRSRTGRRHTTTYARQGQWARESGEHVAESHRPGIWSQQTDDDHFHRWGEGDLERESTRSRERAAEAESRHEPDWSAWSTPDSSTDSGYGGSSSWDSDSSTGSDW
ncbi:hypothetical protein ACWEO4_24600 [Streptomyces sp. NPDC004393]|uniref:hypothetical protein n=1 Tax=Streptomyces sp. NPDC004533 TaxID=3154278 RepID=UPI0033A0BEBD